MGDFSLGPRGHVDFEIPHVAVYAVAMSHTPAPSKYAARYRMMIEPQCLVPLHGDLSFLDKHRAAKSFAVTWSK